MPDLSQSLHDQDSSYLRIVADLWGIVPEISNHQLTWEDLTNKLLEPELVSEIIQSLPPEARVALDELMRHEGFLPWTRFTRHFGEVREMGEAKRNRLRPYLNPVSIAEILWYRALIARTFLDTPSGIQEFAYIPSDMLALLPHPTTTIQTTLARPASQVERAHLLQANDQILDHACTLLTALRMGFRHDSQEFLDLSWDSTGSYTLTPMALQELLVAAEIIDTESELPQIENARLFLESTRAEALSLLATVWRRSPTFNELHQLPGVDMEGDWQNDPLQTRNMIFDVLISLPKDTWWSLTSFIEAIKQNYPDFQRPAGDYDSWYLRDRKTGEFLRGFEHWDEVDGALIRYLITGPLYWLGYLELASPMQGERPTAFRFSSWSSELLEGQPPKGFADENEKVTIQSNAQLSAPRLIPRTARYQIARFCYWESVHGQSYHYRLTPASLTRARQQGLRVNHLLKLLQRYAESVPPNLIRALDRWEEHGAEARIERALILRLKSPDILQALRLSRAARFLGDPLGPTVVIVKPGAWEKVLAVLVEMGYLGEAEFGE